MEVYMNSRVCVFMWQLLLYVCSIYIQGANKNIGGLDEFVRVCVCWAVVQMHCLEQSWSTCDHMAIIGSHLQYGWAALIGQSASPLRPWQGAGRSRQATERMRSEQGFYHFPLRAHQEQHMLCWQHKVERRNKGEGVLHWETQREREGEAVIAVSINPITHNYTKDSYNNQGNLGLWSFNNTNCD